MLVPNFITRYAPSNTGDPHGGNLRTALFCFLTARQRNGTFFLRIEDTDLERSSHASTELIKESLIWTGLYWDGELVKQSERKEYYDNFLEKLIEKKLVFSCECTDGPTCNCESKNLPISTKYGVRFKTPREGQGIINDGILGEILQSYSLIESFMLRRSGGQYTYNLCVVADDIAMNITHIIRGQDHVMNTFKQKFLYDALEVKMPEIYHLPLIRTEKKTKMSKRSGDFSISDWRLRGILPEAVISTLARLGWSYNHQDYFTMDDLLNYFNISNVQKSPACFDEDKLLVTSAYFLRKMENPILINKLIEFLQYYIKKTGNEKYNKTIESLEKNPNIWLRSLDIIKQRSRTMLEIIDLSEFIYDFSFPKISLKEEEKDILIELVSFLESIPTEYIEDIDCFNKNIKKITKDDKIIFRNISSILRIILVNKPVSPPTIETINVLGVQETIQRIKKIIME